MFWSVLMVSATDLAEAMNDDRLISELKENVQTTCAFPIYVSDTFYDCDDMSYQARISRWMNENCGLNKTEIYVEVEV